MAQPRLSYAAAKRSRTDVKHKSVSPHPADPALPRLGASKVLALLYGKVRCVSGQVVIASLSLRTAGQYRLHMCSADCCAGYFGPRLLCFSSDQSVSSTCKSLPEMTAWLSLPLSNSCTPESVSGSAALQCPRTPQLFCTQTYIPCITKGFIARDSPSDA